jgi:hypothetical protein
VIRPGALRPTNALHAASHPRLNALTEPAQGIDRFPGAATGHRHAQPGEAANQTSTNWAGYAATGGTYQTVTASWIEPSVTCTSDGIVAFWVGLDGWGSSTVEQTGTGVDCSSGSPQQFAWWETYPANSVQEYDDPVSAGDQLTSTVTAEPGGVYNLVLTDTTKGWTETNPVHVTGATNASAEVVAEAVSSGNTITPLPDFHDVAFTGSTIDGGSLQASGAVPVDMTDDAGNPIAETQNTDAAGDFQVDYTGPTSGVLAPATTKLAKSAPAPASAAATAFASRTPQPPMFVLPAQFPPATKSDSGLHLAK